MQLALIMYDQLSHDLPTFRHIDKAKDVILMVEVVDLTTHVAHHKKKLVFIFSAMRHFAAHLKRDGFNVIYRQIDDPQHSGSLCEELEKEISNRDYQSVIYTHPSEYTDWINIQKLLKSRAVDARCLDDARFLATEEEFKDFAHDKKQLRMEYFYRQMRKKYNILMNHDEPEGGKWNYDAENRKFPKGQLDIPPTYHKDPDEITQAVIECVSEKFSHHFGDIMPFHLAVTREDALIALKKFIEQRLEHFGDFQDAMVQGEPWMYHAHISFYINIGLLNPLECIKMAESTYYHKGYPLNAVEGFIRQILGWREYIRGIYWLKMPEYKTLNFLSAERKLPDFYWTGDTPMNCLAQSVKETKNNAYAHHIQRLMVLGNFALLAGIHPDEINNWYWIVYLDAYEWVELPNVSGMVLFADGGLLASKPYAAGGSYINKMSNYCQSCQFKVAVKTGEDACPFNYLYWDFLMRNQKELSNNPRIAMMYRTIAKMPQEKINAIKDSADQFLSQL
tara:strand:- start:205 stop:1722 length:1518 start_codon:yes stop_codon:yes gene_type:complete